MFGRVVATVAPFDLDDVRASLEAVPPGVPVVVRLVCDGPVHEVPLATPGVLDLRWLHRTGGPGDADLLPAAVRDLAFSAGRVHAFVHGEASEVRAVRWHLLADRGVARADLSASPVLAAAHDRRGVARDQSRLERRGRARRLTPGTATRLTTAAPHTPRVHATLNPSVDAVVEAQRWSRCGPGSVCTVVQRSTTRRRSACARYDVRPG